MTKNELMEILRKVLKTDANLDFLLRLNEEELESLVACIRDRLGYPGKVDSRDKTRSKKTVKRSTP